MNDVTISTVEYITLLEHKLNTLNLESESNPYIDELDYEINYLEFKIKDLKSKLS